MTNLNSLVVFTKVAESKSFTNAAQRLGLTTSAVSKSMSRLEHELGVQLLLRSTRLISLTDDGAIFFERCRHILAEIDDAKDALLLRKQEPHGRLKVLMPVAFGTRVIAPTLTRFIDEYPDIVVDVEFSNRTADLVFEGIDVAIHIGPVTHDRLAVRSLGQLSFSAYASKDYLARHGEPATPDDLDRHHCLAYAFPLSGAYREWLFEKDGKVIAKTVSGRLNMNDSESLLAAVAAGAGIAMVSSYIARDAVRTHKLERILTQYAATGPALQVVYPRGRHLSRKTRVFVDFIVDVVATLNQD